MTENRETFTITIPKQFTWWMGLGGLILVLGLILTWLFSVESRILEQDKAEITQLQEELQECKDEATAWYNSSTALSDAIALQALRGGLAENVDTNIAISFAVKGHELKCIEPKMPTG